MYDVQGGGRLIAAVSELGLGSAAQAASSGSLVVPAWVGAAPAFFLEPCGIFLGAKQRSGWQMLNTTPVRPYQKVVELCKNCFSSPNEAHRKLTQSWELPEGVRCDISTCGLHSLFAAPELKLPLLGSALCLNVACLKPTLCLRALVP